jgi:excisionase family DNA binding protein
MSNDIPLTLSVPEAGRQYFGLSRNGSYAAAERGEIPTVRIGRLLRVPVRALDQILEKAAKFGPEAS